MNNTHPTPSLKMPIYSSGNRELGTQPRASRGLCQKSLCTPEPLDRPNPACTMCGANVPQDIAREIMGMCACVCLKEDNADASVSNGGAKASTRHHVACRAYHP